MKKMFILIFLMVLMVGCGEKSFKKIQTEMNSKTLIKDKIEYLGKIQTEGRYKKEDSDKLQYMAENLMAELKKEEIENKKIEEEKRRIEEQKRKIEEEKREIEIENKKIEALLPPRDGFSSGIAFSVINYLKENMKNLDVEYINGGNTLRLSNGLFFQNARFKVTNILGQSAEYNSYFLIKDNGYTSNSISGFLETSNDFFDNYLKKNKIKISEDEVYNYYFGE